jgi:hypothetical protein
MLLMHVEHMAVLGGGSLCLGARASCTRLVLLTREPCGSSHPMESLGCLLEPKVHTHTLQRLGVVKGVVKVTACMWCDMLLSHRLPTHPGWIHAV